MKFREFQKYFPSTINFLNKDEGTSATMVLDGQQRIQSLYACCFGSIDNKEVYFNILSGYPDLKGSIEKQEIKKESSDEKDEISYADEIFEFKFLKDNEVSQRNSNEKIFIKLPKLLFAKPKDIENYKIELGETYKLSINDKALISTNITTLREAFNRHDYFSFYTIDKQLLSENTAKNISEVLEIFVRVNSMGTQLSKSELIFSLIKSKWEDAFETFGEITKQLNEPDKFFFDNDFIIKCLLTIHTLQSRFAVEKLKDNIIKKFMDENNILKFTNAMVFFKNFLTEKCLLRCDTVFNKSYNTFLPVIYYLYNHPNNIIPESEEKKVIFFIYSSLMKKYISRYTDSRVPKLLKEKFAEIQKNPSYFPLKESMEYLETFEGKLNIDDDAILNSNISLIMNIVYKGIILPPYQRTTHKDLDHIYPKSKLDGYSDEKINTYGNFRFIDNVINKIKSDKDPSTYFKNLPEDILLKEHLVDKKLLFKDQYDSFIVDRQQRIRDKVNMFLAY
jgi:hypothetical protein